MKNFRNFVVAICMLLAGTAYASVTYTFQAMSSYSIGDVTSLQSSFSLVTPDFIIPDQTFSSNSLFSCSVASPASASCGDMTFTKINGNDVVEFGLTGQTFIYYYFAPDAFSTIGTHESIILGPQQFATLNVATIAAVPEPETYAMLLVGLGLMGGIARRRKQQ